MAKCFGCDGELGSGDYYFLYPADQYRERYGDLYRADKRFRRVVRVEGQHWHLGSIGLP